MRERQPELIRGLGLVAATCVVMGTVIGTGIFLVSSSMMTAVKEPPTLLLVWIVGAVLSLFGALSFAELGAMMPEAGGEFVYLRRGLGRLPAYLFGWTLFTVARPGSIAGMATGFALYVTVLFPFLDVTLYRRDVHLLGAGFSLTVGGVQLLALGLIALLSSVNFLGVRLGGRVQTIFTLSKVGGMMALVVLGLGLGKGQWSHFGERALGTLDGGALTLFGVALIQALWAYDGWDNLGFVAGEVEKPQRNIPRALILGVSVVALLYVSVNLAYVYVLSPQAIATSSRVASDTAQQALGLWGANFIALVAAVSTFASVNGSILAGSRVPYAVARGGLLFRPLARVHPRWRTPYVALAVQAVLAIVLVFSGTYTDIVTYVIFSEWVFYGLTILGLFLLRRREPAAARPYRTWGYPWVPGVFLISSGLLLVNTLVKQPVQSGFGLLIILAGLPLYPIFRRSRRAEQAEG